jgi:hypothetical protein
VDDDNLQFHVLSYLNTNNVSYQPIKHDAFIQAQRKEFVVLPPVSHDVGFAPLLAFLSP